MAWKEIQRFANTYGFTANEAKAIVFISACVLTAVAWSFVGKEELRPSESLEDAYRRMDSVYKARAQAPMAFDTLPEAYVYFNDDGMKLPQGTETYSRKLLNLNTATSEHLDRLPGVGPTTAKYILKYREEHGGFTTIEDLKKVYSIGEKKFNRLKPYICVD
ncbi:MAG: hypothetical protein CL946_03010 [Ectothiorhodospiraceae bacterium]|nr:hypothetical protein [Ectothiorhodospiraceae bacterium]